MTVSIEASHPKGLAPAEKNLTLGCHVGWSLNLYIHYAH